MPKVTEITPPEPPKTDPDMPDSGENSPLEPAEPFMGRPRADGAPPGSLKGPTQGAPDPDLIIPSPRFNKYASDHVNAPQRTGKLWAWCSQLKKDSPRLVEQLVGYVYRDFPPLKSTLKEDEYDYIDVVAGVDMFESDTALNDRYGAGDFHLFLNVGTGKPPYKRTLATAFVKGSRDFKSLPPSDKRITETGEDGFPKWIDRDDPQCRSYIEYLRSRGIIPELKHVQEEKKMAEATAQAQQGSLVEKLVDKVIAQQQPPAAPKSTSLESDTIKSVIDASLSGARASTEMLVNTIKTLQDPALMGNKGGDATAMLGIALEIADKISKANNPEPYLNIINKLNDTVMNMKMEMLDAKIDQLKAAQAGPTANPVQAGVSSLKSTIEDFKSIKELFGDMSGDAAEEVATSKMPWWAGMLTNALPLVEKLGLGLLQAYLVSQARAGQPGAPPPTTAPPTNINPMPTTAPPFAQPQPTTPVQPQPQPAPATALLAGLTPEQQALMQLVASTAVPITNCLIDGQGGDDYADWFGGGFGDQIYDDVVKLGEPMLLMAITSYPPIMERLNTAEPPITNEQIVKFVHEFCVFDEDAYEAKKARQEREEGIKEIKERIEPKPGPVPAA